MHEARATLETLFSKTHDRFFQSVEPIECHSDSGDRQSLVTLR
jgi:hypothetical protein